VAVDGRAVAVDLKYKYFMKAANQPLIVMKDVKKSYFLANGREVPVLHGIDIEINRKEFVAIMGESGGGKSTLMNIIGCLHAPTSGAYFFEGEDIGGAKDDYTLAYIRNKKIGFVFQQFNLLGKLTALKNVALPGLYAGRNRREREKRGAEILATIGMGERLHHKPAELSGGQQQRVSIARAMVNDPDVILADEPTGALDSQTGKEVMDLFLDFKNRGKTVVMVTHDHAVAKYADRVIFMKDGLVLDSNYQLDA
jgi:putative ABC transport system ATP-binding protein